jgi:hypothetical protein
MKRSFPGSDTGVDVDAGAGWHDEHEPDTGREVTPRRDTARDSGSSLRTEFPFVLPRGYVDGAGTLHREGVMRMATARDELVPLHDDRVRENPSYLTVVLLARVITRIGGITDVHAGTIENLFAADLAFLQELYRRINTEGHTRAAVTCPACKHEMTVDLAGGRSGES